MQIETLEQRAMLASDTYVVTLATDSAEPVENQLTLRQAIALAGADGSGDQDRIEFDPSLRGQTITLSQELYVASDVTIVGLGMGETIISGGGQHRVFRTYAYGVTISHLTIADGFTTGYGAGVWAIGTLTLEGVEIRDNEALDFAGGIYSHQGDLYVLGSYIHDNESQRAGAIHKRTQGTEVSRIEATTISDNIATDVFGGIVYEGWAAAGTSHTIVNSTISGNKASQVAAVAARGNMPLHILNSTLTENEASVVSGIHNLNQTALITIQNSIVLGNSGGAYSSDVWGAITAESSNNLFGYAEYLTSTQLQEEFANHRNVSFAEAKLAPLGDYGGPTPTYALLAGSPAIDAGANAAASGLAYDQRAGDGTALVDRVVGSVVDIGAFEYGAPVIAVAPKFAVNAGFMSGSQTDSWVATNAAGLSVVVWKGDGPEGFGVYRQQMDGGTSQTSLPRLVDLGHDDTTVRTPRVAVDGEGRYVVTWRIPSGANAGIWLRRFNEIGAPLDALPVQVAVDNNSTPTVVANEAGRLVVAWKGNDGDLYFRRYTAGGLNLDGAPRRAISGPLTTPSSGRQLALSADGSMHFLYSSSTTDGPRLLLQSLSESGQLLGEPKAVVAPADPSQVPVPLDIVSGATGLPVILWKTSHVDEDPANGWLLTYWESLYVSSPDVPPLLVAEGVSHDYETFTVSKPAIALDASGHLGVAFERNIYEYGDQAAEIRAAVRFFDAVGEVFGPEHIVHSTTLALPFEQGLVSPSISASADGRFQFTYSQVQGAGGQSSDVYAQRFTLPQRASLVGGKLVVDNSIIQSPDVVLGARRHDGQLMVTLNGNVTHVAAGDVTEIAVLGGPAGDFIDLRQVTSGSFSNLAGAAITVHAGAGNDTIFASPLGGTIYGGDGDDHIVGGDGNDVIYGGAGNDLIFGGAGDDLLFGEGGNDSLHGGTGNDTLDGGECDDRLEGGSEGDKVLVGGGGNDYYSITAGGTGTNQVEVTEGIGTLDFSTAIGPVVLDLGASTLSVAGVPFALSGRFGRVIGSAHDDELTGDEFADVIDGGEGDDEITGGGGDDVLIGGAGNDTLRGGEMAAAGIMTFNGGTGDDLYIIDPFTSAATITLRDASGDADELNLGTTVPTESAIAALAAGQSYTFGNATVLGDTAAIDVWPNPQAPPAIGPKPRFTSPGQQGLVWDASSDLALGVELPEGDDSALVVSFAEGSAAGFALEKLDDTWWLKAAGATSGEHRIRLLVTDPSTGGAVSNEFTLFARFGAGPAAPAGLSELSGAWLTAVDGVISVNEAELLELPSPFDGNAAHFALAPGAPRDASIHPTTGVFSWTPAEDQDAAEPYEITILASNGGNRPLQVRKTFYVQGTAQK